MMPRFGRAIPQLSMISNKMLNILYDDWGHLLRDFNNLQLYADAIHQSGTPLQTCWGFVDGTVRAISKPGRNQRTV